MRKKPERNQDMLLFIRREEIKDKWLGHGEGGWQIRTITSMNLTLDSATYLTPYRKWTYHYMLIAVFLLQFDVMVYPGD